MPKRKVKVPETLDFVKGLLISADELSEALSGELEPRKVLAQQHTKIASLTPEQIQDLGMYQGRVVLVALAAELALKFAWERENQGGATDVHDLKKLYDGLSDTLKDKIRSEYQRRVTDPLEKGWETADQVFNICRSAFVGWRYIVEEGSYPNYIMRATYLEEATLSVIHVVNQREGGDV